MMKKKFKEQQELNKEAINKGTEDKEHSNEPEINAGRDQENYVSDESTGPLDGIVNKGDIAADKVVSEVNTAEEKLSEMQDKYIRLSAEFDNYRKRTLREKMELSKYAAEDLFLNHTTHG